MRQTRALKQVLERSLSGLDDAYSASEFERRQSLEDREFYLVAGKQWAGSLGDQFENKPRFEFNKVHLSVIRLFNEYRNNPIAVDFVAKDEAQNDELSDACDMMLRADEQDSNAEEAYDNAFEEATAGGYGGYRLCAKYEDDGDEENERQRIHIMPIFEADQCLYFDVNAKRQDKADAERAWLLTSMHPETYKEKYGKDISSVDKRAADGFSWESSEVVYIAEYYEIEDQGYTVFDYESLTGETKRFTEDDFEDDDGDEEEEGKANLRQELENTGWTLKRTRKITRKRVHKYIHDGAEILEDCGFIAGECIPLIPQYGKRAYVNGVERFSGHVRLAKDPQRLKNMQISKLAEYAAMSSMEKPILTPEQVAGHVHMWQDDNIQQYPFLLINPIEDASGQKLPAGPVAYTKPPTIPPAMSALLQGTEFDLKEILGSAQLGEKMEANQSGKAVELIQNKIDMQAFIYTSNAAKARKRGAEVWLSMAKELYAEKGRKIRGLTKENKPQAIELGREILQEGKVIAEVDMARAKLDVATTVGPASSSRKAATVRALSNTAMIVQDPNERAAIIGTMMLNMEGEGLQDLREYYRKRMVQIGAAKPTDDDKREAEEAKKTAQPDPNAELVKAAAQREAAEAANAEADALLKVEKMVLTQAQTIETLSKVGEMEQAQAIQAMEALQAQNQPQTPPAQGNANQAAPMPETGA